MFTSGTRLPSVRAQVWTLQETLNTFSRIIVTEHRSPFAGERMALAARALAYGEAVHYTGPVADTLTIKGDQLFIGFSGALTPLSFRTIAQTTVRMETPQPLRRFATMHAENSGWQCHQ